MEKLYDFFRSIAARGLTVRAESGQALIEYALIISLIALVCIGALSATGTNVSNIFATVASDV